MKHYYIPFLILFLTFSLSCSDDGNKSDDISNEQVSKLEAPIEVIEEPEAEQVVEEPETEQVVEEPEVEKVIEEQESKNILEDTPSIDKVEKKVSVEVNEPFLSANKIIILSLIVLSLFFGFIILFLLRWRLKHNKTLTTFPENLFDTLESLDKNSTTSSENFKKQVDHFNKVLKYIRITQEDNNKNFNEIIESYSKLSESINEKEEEIKKLRKGYESKETIYLVRRMIKLHEDLYNSSIDEKKSNETKEEVKLLLNNLENKLDESGVKSYTIEPGTSVTDTNQFGIPDSSDWVLESTDKKEKNNVVSSTIEKGFYFDGEEKTILKNVKIKVYKFN